MSSFEMFIYRKSFFESFCIAFFKKRSQSNARSVGRASQGAKSLTVRERHKRVNFENHQGFRKRETNGA
jgi:hypothetical protein